MSRCYLVTGAAGFIGYYLCRYIRDQGHGVRALLRRPAEGPWEKAFQGDLADQALPNGLMEGVEGVFHLAGIAHVQGFSQDNVPPYWKVNVEGTDTLLAAAHQAGVKRFVYFSSVKAAADPAEQCVDESWNTPPTEPYGLSKREAEQRVLQAGHEKSMHVCNLRPSLVYGPGAKGNLFQMMQAIEQGTFPPLPEFNNRRSLVSLHDLVAAAWLAMVNDEAQGKTYIVCENEPYSSRQIYEAMCRALGKKIPEWQVPSWIFQTTAWIGDLINSLTGSTLPMDSTRLQKLAGSACYRSDRIREELNWQSTRTLNDVLPEMVKARTTGV